MTDEQALPSWAEVHNALGKLRGSDGLSRDGIVAHGGNLERLPIVTDEMRRRGMPDDTRPDMTVAVVRCAVHHLVTDLEWRMFLRHTLTDVDRAKGLMERRYAAAEAMGRFGSAPNALKLIEARAYRELASALIQATRSPCALDLSAAIEGSAAEAIAALAVLMPLLQQVASTHSLLSREAASTALLDFLPIGASRTHPSMTNVDKARFLIVVAMSADGWLTADLEHADMRAYWTLQFLVIDRGARRIKQVVARTLDNPQILKLREGPDFRAAEIGRIEELDAYTEKRDAALRSIAAQVVREEESGWPSLGGGSTTRAADKAPVPV